MDERVYAVASGKGGVGKTTAVVNLGVALRARDRSVAVVDADLDMPNLGTYLGVEHRPTIHDVLAGDATVDDALAEHAEGFAVLPGDRSLDRIAAADPAGLDEVVAAVADRGFEYVLVDTGAGLSHGDVVPLGLGAGIVLVTTPDAAAVDDTRRTAAVADRLGGTVRGVVVNRADDSVDPEGLARELGGELLGTIPEDPALATSVRERRPVRAVDPDAPATRAFAALAGTLAGAPDERPERDDATTTADGDRAATGGDEPERGASTEADEPATQDDDSSTADDDRSGEPGDGDGEQKRGDGADAGRPPARTGEDDDAGPERGRVAGWLRGLFG